MKIMAYVSEMKMAIWRKRRGGGEEMKIMAK